MPQLVYMSEVITPNDVRLFVNEPDIMTVPHVAQLLGVNAATVRREIARGRLACVHVGTAVRITKRQLLAYVGEAVNDGEE